MTRRTLTSLGVVSALELAARAQQPPARQHRTSEMGYTDTPLLPNQKWRVHDINRPQPPQVTPGSKPGAPPSDAVVLFDGKDLSQWTEGNGQPAKWKVENGYMERAGEGSLTSKEKFGDCQIHLEWCAPAEVVDAGQWRGNSGVIIMNRYEIQVLDSWNNPTYPDGQAGSIYGQWPPMVNAALQPGQWQTYDIVFDAPRFEAGKLTKPAYVTVIHNGVLIHHRQEIIGQMAHREIRKYEPHAPEEPLGLQNHHDTAVRFRNIWVRRLKGYDQS